MPPRLLACLLLSLTPAPSPLPTALPYHMYRLRVQSELQILQSLRHIDAEVGSVLQLS
jgi:hypothetical protein